MSNFDFDFAENEWKRAPRPWQEFTRHWRSQDVENIVREDVMHLHLADDLPSRNRSILILEPYRRFHRQLVKYQQLRPEGAVLLTGQPGTG
ncbi:uncharacterized protein PHACADRAFT_266152 [Phanerochaete carnosa HHB-10118-sp]|uniref:Uncharacterized protein n=1 Tax=Phanerochaete carnosa (strain HHB-10118-sp) TaxID=650164 RepID=K5VCF5_PHACS|nr:uncharacterized protein PHACADRAFT_266152 [Phanerochaete carnosa HHB-10118-sp]EKM48768.1 hypothetical protein PHACADRAFT_266152 [Phanerochaete carnosa HHB-10118-sp]